MSDCQICEYCLDNMKSKPIRDDYAIQTIIDSQFIYNYCDCGKHTVTEINYCPICGRNLKEE